MHELREVQLTKISQKIKNLKAGAVAEAVIAAAGLVGVAFTSGTSLGATLMAIAAGYHTYSEYREKIRENPAYFLWRIHRA